MNSKRKPFAKRILALSVLSVAIVACGGSPLSPPTPRPVPTLSIPDFLRDTPTPEPTGLTRDEERWLSDLYRELAILGEALINTGLSFARANEDMTLWLNDEWRSSILSELTRAEGAAQELMNFASPSTRFKGASQNISSMASFVLKAVPQCRTAINNLDADALVRCADNFTRAGEELVDLKVELDRLAQ